MIYLDHLLEATQGYLLGTSSFRHFEGFSHDTRQLLPGELFVAVRGERGDGHDFLRDALQRGAHGLLIEARSLENLSKERHAELEQTTTIVVADTRIALQQYAHFILHSWHPTVIAVTGSVGKTSTKEAIATVLSANYSTFRSWQNYNDLLGLPLSLGRLTEQHEYAVLELGCDHPGEIADLCRITQPQIGVLTNISPVQLQYFGSLDELANELCSLFTQLTGRRVALFNQQDALTRSTLAKRILPSTATVFTSFDPARFHTIQLDWSGIRATLDTAPALQFASPLLGQHHLATMLAAYQVAQLCGMQNEEILPALAHLRPLNGRLKPLTGQYSSTLLDDSHNAAPAAVIAGLQTLRSLPTGRRIAILGDMQALGGYEAEAHRLIGQEAARCVDYLITRGERAALSAEAAQQAGLSSEQTIVTSTHEDAARVALTLLEDDAVSTTILIKGSEGTRMERVTELLLADRSQAPEQLVRQTLGWKQIVMTRPERPTWVEIDLSAIGHNTRRIKELVGTQVQVLVSLKADAYGHGALKVARTVLHNGASMLGVATLSEATPLRAAGISAPILVFGYVPLWQMREAVRQDITVTLYELEAARALARAARALGKTIKVHVKVDTGMGRLGIRFEQLEQILALIREIKQLPELIYEGLYTHFAVADTTDQHYALRQLARFQQVLQQVEEQGLRPPIVHAANSAAMLSLPAARFDMVRPGIAIYGLDPSPEVRVPADFRAALSFKTQVSQVKTIPAGEGISYGYTYFTERPTRIAVLPVGYADGFRRGPNNWGVVLLHGQEAPILGRVCMDQCMIDVTDIPQTRIGDEVVLIGVQGSASLSAERVAARLGTVNYEVVSEILARVPRVD